jgi:hypothetical protein
MVKKVATHTLLGLVSPWSQTKHVNDVKQAMQKKPPITYVLTTAASLDRVGVLIDDD